MDATDATSKTMCDKAIRQYMWLWHCDQLIKALAKEAFNEKQTKA